MCQEIDKTVRLVHQSSMKIVLDRVRIVIDAEWHCDRAVNALRLDTNRSAFTA